MPTIKFFWSMTMYDLPGRQLVANSINRYAIGSRSPGIKTNADGSVDIYLQSTSPGADKETNWLPTPSNGPFFMVLRMYGAGRIACRRKLASPATDGSEIEPHAKEYSI